jgi:hypothetical protein
MQKDYEDSNESVVLDVTIYTSVHGLCNDIARDGVSQAKYDYY